MDTPPPLPALKRPIQFVTFQGRDIPVTSKSQYFVKLQSAQQAAADWLNANPDIEIITIESSTSDLLCAVTVWYR